MQRRDPDLRRTWLFGPGASASAHQAMLDSSADALIVDLEDFTPAAQRGEARHLLKGMAEKCRLRDSLFAVRVNQLDHVDGAADLAAAMASQPDVIACPMAERSHQIRDLDAAISGWERTLSIAPGSTELLPVCETALGVLEVRALAVASARIRCAMLGTEDLAADLCAERGPDALELDYARRRFVLECRAVRIEPIDAPYTYADAAGAIREATYARRLGYRSKGLVRPEHASFVNDVFTPNETALCQAQAVVEAFEAARARGEERALVDGQWIEVPTYRNAWRLVRQAQRRRAREAA